MSWQEKEIKKIRYPRKKRSSHGAAKNFFSLIAILILAALVSFGLFYLWVSFSLPNPDKLLEREVAQSTRIYDREGKTVLYEVFSSARRTMVDLSQVSPYLVKATITSEDRYFYEHSGFSLKSTLRAVFIDLTRGGKVQGGSTITQQLVKNAILRPEKTFIRKFKELILAFQIEKKFTKDQILKMYFNEIPFGANAYGAEAAAQLYFSKSAVDLTLDESALLVAMLKAPTYYSPYGQNKEQLKSRRDYLLGQMENLGFISKEEHDQAKKIDTLAKIKPKKERIIAPHFVMDIKEQLVERYGQRMVEQGGLRIITTIDLKMQKIAEEAIKNNEANLKKYKANNAALVALDVKTGEILAMVGSKDFFDETIDGYVNVTTSARQPGSSFKPIVYSKFFEKGYTPETILFDVETNFGPDGTGKDYIPKDYDEKERGPLIVRKVLAGSLNIPAVKALYLTGVENVLNLAEKMGYTTFADRSRFGLAIVLGGAEVKLLEHTAAFGVLAREGLKKPTVSILKVEDSDGEILEEKKDNPVQWEQVLDPEITRKVTSILSDNSARAFMFGEKNYLTLPDRPVVAKTGTTQNWHDAWTLGYTPSLACGVWTGNTRNEEMKKGADGSMVAAPIWHEFMVNATRKMPIENFTPPAPDLVDKPILNGEIPADNIVKIDRASGKLATELTPPSFVEEKKYNKVYHSILYYVDKDNPRGPIPEHPANDPMYGRWEDAITYWARKKGIVFETPPTEYDDLHTLANKPSLSITSPDDGFVVSTDSFLINVSTEAARGVRRVEGLIDDIVFDTSYNFPFNLSLNTTGFSVGYHRLTARACDDIDNCAETSININLANNSAPKIFWLSPQNNQTIYAESFPYPLSLSLPNLKIQEIKFYAQKIGGAKQLISTISSPSSRRLTLNWLDIPGSGDYELSVGAISEGGFPIESEKIFIKLYE